MKSNRLIQILVVFIILPILFLSIGVINGGSFSDKLIRLDIGDSWVYEDQENTLYNYSVTEISDYIGEESDGTIEVINFNDKLSPKLGEFWFPEMTYNLFGNTLVVYNTSSESRLVDHIVYWNGAIVGNISFQILNISESRSARGNFPVAADIGLRVIPIINTTDLVFNRTGDISGYIKFEHGDRAITIITGNIYYDTSMAYMDACIEENNTEFGYGIHSTRDFRFSASTPYTTIFKQTNITAVNITQKETSNSYSFYITKRVNGILVFDATFYLCPEMVTNTKTFAKDIGLAITETVEYTMFQIPDNITLPNGLITMRKSQETKVVSSYTLSKFNIDGSGFVMITIVTTTSNIASFHFFSLFGIFIFIIIKRRLIRR